MNNKDHKQAKGHELPLSSMIKNGYQIEIILMNRQDDIVVGRVMSFDSYTITILKENDQFPTTYFKHAVLSFTRID